MRHAHKAMEIDDDGWMNGWDDDHEREYSTQNTPQTNNDKIQQVLINLLYIITSMEDVSNIIILNIKYSSFCNIEVWKFCPSSGARTCWMLVGYLLTSQGTRVVVGDAIHPTHRVVEVGTVALSVVCFARAVVSWGHLTVTDINYFWVIHVVLKMLKMTHQNKRKKQKTNCRLFTWLLKICLQVFHVYNLCGNYFIVLGAFTVRIKQVLKLLWLYPRLRTGMEGWAVLTSNWWCTRWDTSRRPPHRQACWRHRRHTPSHLLTRTRRRKPCPPSCHCIQQYRSVTSSIGVWQTG